MSDYHLPTGKQILLILLGWSWLICGSAGPTSAQVVHFKQLMPYVDIAIPGWTMQGKPCGTTLKQGNVMISEARVSFKAGDRSLEVLVMDFLGKPLPFLLGQHLEMDCSEEVVRTTEIQGFRALESYRHQDKQGELSISVADRFWVKIDGSGIDNLDMLKDAARHMDLKKMATLAQ